VLRDLNPRIKKESLINDLIFDYQNLILLRRFFIYCFDLSSSSSTLSSKTYSSSSRLFIEMCSPSEPKKFPIFPKRVSMIYPSCKSSHLFIFFTTSSKSSTLKLRIGLYPFESSNGLVVYFKKILILLESFS